MFSITFKFQLLISIHKGCGLPLLGPPCTGNEQKQALQFVQKVQQARPHVPQIDFMVMALQGKKVA